MSAVSIYVTAPRGLVGLLADELRELGARVVREQPGGCRVRGPLSFAYRICMWSRIANRVLVHVADVPAPDGDALYRNALEIAWEQHLPSEGTFAIDAVLSEAAISDARWATHRIKDAIVDRARARSGARPQVDLDAPGVRINAYLRGRGASLAIDLGGESLHRRGWRANQGAAPLKENIAAAVLRFGGWPEIAARRGSFVDPMAGAGTLAIEAATMAADIAPRLRRERWGFSGWLGHEPEAWQQVLDDARVRAENFDRTTMPFVLACDGDAEMIEMARDNARRAGVEDLVTFETRALRAWVPEDTPVEAGLVAMNPPHGERLGDKAGMSGLYARIGRTLSRCFPSWCAAVLTTDDLLAHAMGLPATHRHPTSNGPLDAQVIVIDVPARGTVGAVRSALAAEGEAFANRLHKNAERLEPWLRRENVTCYRLYDADIPEFAIAIDRYEHWVHVQEYEAPREIDAEAAARRLDAMLAVLPDALDVEPSAIRLKRRRRHRAGGQYQRVAEGGARLEVHEGGHRFGVNLDDRIDTGLFLDHRTLRRWVGELTVDRTFLNLFAYTGTGSVYAAASGARTTSVDLSNTYLDWAEDNFRRNDLFGAHQQLVRSDVFEFLRRKPGRWDTIWLDPPTYSRSKAMRGDLDVVRDHPELIDLAMACLERDGVLLFTTHARRFVLAPEVLDRFAVEDVTEASLPPDFRRRPSIHSAFRIRRA